MPVGIWKQLKRRLGFPQHMYAQCVWIGFSLSKIAKGVISFSGKTGSDHNEKVIAVSCCIVIPMVISAYGGLKPA